MYTIDQAFEILAAYRVTTHKETVRNWVRKGIIQAEPLESRKKGYRVSEESLRTFLSSRLPEGWERFGPLAENQEQPIGRDDDKDVPRYTEQEVEAIKEQVREEMWFKLMDKFIFERYFVLKKSDIKAAIQYRRHSKDFEDFVWERCSKHKFGFATPRVKYLFGYFEFEGERIPFDRDFGDLDEQIIYALIERIRVKRVSGQYRAEEKD